MAELLPVLGSLGGGGALALVIVYLLASNRADRKDAREAINDAERRADDAEERARRANADLDAALARARRAEAQLPLQDRP